MNFKSLMLIGGGLLLLSGCGSSTVEYSASAPNGIISAVQSALQTAGGAMVTGRKSIKSPFDMFRISPAVCDVHGYPVVSQSDDNYPGYLTYCFVTVDEGDTVIGGFSTAKSVTCALQEAGVVYDGTTQAITLNPASSCFDGMMDDRAPTMTGTVTASSPASFNTNFDKGVILDLSSSIGLTFKIAANASGGKISFITHENWSSDNYSGAHHGSMDTTTGDLHYEAREERLSCTVSGSCGWNRHTRIAAKVTMSGGVATGLDSISFGYSNIQSTPGQSSFGGTVVTASGDLTTGIKARLWNATDGSSGQPTSVADYQTPGNWEENLNLACYTHSSEVAGTCGTGIPLFTTDTKYVLDTTQTNLDTWFTSRSTQTFTAVDLDQDVQN